MIRRILEAIDEKEFTPAQGVVEPEGFEPPFLAYVAHPPGINYGMSVLVPDKQGYGPGYGTAREAVDAAKAAAAELGEGAGWYVVDDNKKVVDEVVPADEEDFFPIDEKEFTPRGDVLEPGGVKYTFSTDAWGKPSRDYYFSDESPFGLFTFFLNTVQDANELGGVDDGAEYIRLMNQIADEAMRRAHALPATPGAKPKYPPPHLAKGQGAPDQWLFKGNVLELLDGPQFAELSDVAKVELLNAMAEEAMDGAHVVKTNYGDEVAGIDPLYPATVAEKEFTPRGDVLEPEPTGQWVDEFGPEYAVPKEVLEHPLMKDMSWHNDSSPSFGRFDDSNDVLVRLWVEHPDPEQREFGPEADRFGVQASGMGKDDPLGILPEYGFQTNDLGEAIAMFEKAYQAYFG